jgi:ribosome-binding protein aMBF1 (putative translation factor)
MDRKKQKRLEAAGWRVGSATEFLGLSAAEEQLVAIKMSLSTRLKKARERSRITQTDLAKRMGSQGCSRFPRLLEIPV